MSIAIDCRLRLLTIILITSDKSEPVFDNFDSKPYNKPNTFVTASVILISV